MLDLKDYNPGDQVKELLTGRTGFVRKRLKYVLAVNFDDGIELNFLPHQVEKIKPI